VEHKSGSDAHKDVSNVNAIWDLETATGIQNMALFVVIINYLITNADIANATKHVLQLPNHSHSNSKTRMTVNAFTSAIQQ
jgi:hypothetical protein